LNLDLSRIGRFRLVFGYLIGLLCLVFAGDELLLPGIAVALAGILLRMWAAGHIQKNSQLATDGPYSLTRNPLYLGSFILGCGVTTAIKAWWLLAAWVIGFAVFYWPTIRREEDGLLRRFGDEYRAYRERVPLFLPWRFGLRGGGFSLSNVVRNREHRYAIGAVAFLILLAAARELRAFLSL